MALATLPGLKRTVSASCSSLVSSLLTCAFLVKGARGLGGAAETTSQRKMPTEPDVPRILQSTVPSIQWNLAFENVLLEDVKPLAPHLFMWQNDKTIVIGHNQNPWRECALKKMEEDGVTLTRRFSGGGAVYQDLGNSCFSFIFPEGTSNITRNNNIVLRALEKTYGIKGEASGRNDLVVDGLKFSGFAAKKRGPLWVHHGTVLRDVDMEGLQRYLTPNKKKLESKGVKSVAARVINLATLNNTITHAGLMAAIGREFSAEFSKGQIEPQWIDQESPVAQRELFKTYLEKLSDWGWRFGITPQFTHHLESRFDWGLVDMHIDVQQGVVKEVKVFSDALQVELPDKLRHALIGCRYGGSNCADRLKEAAEGEAEAMRQQMADVAVWLRTEVDESSKRTSKSEEL